MDVFMAGLWISSSLDLATSLNGFHFISDSLEKSTLLTGEQYETMA